MSFKVDQTQNAIQLGPNTRKYLFLTSLSPPPRNSDVLLKEKEKENSFPTHSLMCFRFFFSVLQILLYTPLSWFYIKWAW